MHIAHGGTFTLPYLISDETNTNERRHLRLDTRCLCGCCHFHHRTIALPPMHDNACPSTWLNMPAQNMSTSRELGHVHKRPPDCEPPPPIAAPATYPHTRRLTADPIWPCPLPLLRNFHLISHCWASNIHDMQYFQSLGARPLLGRGSDDGRAEARGGGGEREIGVERNAGR